jgi:hypothetical protein
VRFNYLPKLNAVARTSTSIVPSPVEARTRQEKTRYAERRIEEGYHETILCISRFG